MRTMLSVFLCLAAALVSNLQPAVGQGDPSLYITPEVLPVRALDAREAFEALTPREKLYAHWMSEASWLGNLITFEQLSPESPDLLRLILGIGAQHPVALRKVATRLGVTDEELKWFEQYAARVLSNCGNYLSFGDTKFIPRLSAEKFALIAAAGDLLSGDAANAEDGSKTPGRLARLFESIREPIYSLDPSVLSLGLGDSGVSAYYGDDVTADEIQLVAEFMKSRGMEAWNTRVFKESDGTLVLAVASALERPPVSAMFRNRSIRIQYGDHARALRMVVEALQEALCYASNDTESKMILSYIAHFNGGDIEDHKASQRYWVLDKGPAVETDLGFIETYRDPMGQRAEWEGFVAMVNKEQTRKFGKLVAKAPELLPLLPWGKAFEKDAFRKPDFTSLEVLTFASSGIPAGINIPNYDDIRQNFGFKNVSLGNVLRSRGSSKERISFLEDKDQDLYRDLVGKSFEVQVGLHELLGHGSGKLFVEDEDGTLNFDPATVDPTTGKSVATWYKPGETWGSKFTTISSSYEECRAEAVGLYLGTDASVLAIFGHAGKEAKDVAYVNWLSMARAGLQALTFYDPSQNRWGQAHMMARFALLRVMLEAGPDLLRVHKDEKGDWFCSLNEAAIETKGRAAIGDFLTRLNVYKATANAEAGRALYEKYTRPDARFLQIRDYVLAHRKPRHVWVQPVTDLTADGQVILREYPATWRGVIDSFVDRYEGLFD